MARKLLFAFAMLVSTPAWAAKGAVVAVCGSHYVVSTTMGFAILEWYGGNEPAKGDVIVGDFESYGLKDLYNLQADSETRAYVDDYWLSRDRAAEKFAEKCD